MKSHSLIPANPHSPEQDQPRPQWGVGPAHAERWLAADLPVRNQQRAAPAPAGAKPLPVGGQGLTGTLWRPGRMIPETARGKGDGLCQTSPFLLHHAPDFPVIIAVAVARIEPIVRPAVELDILGSDPMQRRLEP